MLPHREKKNIHDEKYINIIIHGVMGLNIANTVNYRYKIVKIFL